MQPSKPFTPSSLFVPGQWPREQSSVTPAEESATIAAGKSSYLITFGKWAATVAIANLLVLPVRLAKRFLRQHQIRVQPIVREDGARKKRIIEVDLADEPATQSPTSSARAALARRSHNKRADAATPCMPGIWSPSPSPVQSHERQDSAQPAQPVSKVSLDTHSPPTIYRRIPVKTQLRHAQLKPRSFARTRWSVDESNKVANVPLPPRIFSGPGFNAETLPEILVHPPTVPEYITSIWDSSENSDNAQALANEEADSSMDDSDLSFTDVWTSNTPPRPTLETSTTSTNISSQSLHVPKTTPVRRRRVDGALQISPNSHDEIIRRAPVTPMRKKLVKGQIGYYQRVRRLPVSPTSDHTVSAPAMHITQQTKLRQKEYQASLLKLNAASVAQSEQYAKAREQREAELRAAEPAQFNHVDTIDQDLSWLSDARDASDEEEEVPAPAPPPPATPLPPNKKTVIWALNAGAKPFFCDEAICDMMDSTIESVVFTPRKSLVDELAEAETSESEDESYLSQSPDKASSTESPPRAESVGFTGVPDSTWENTEDSLDESQISIELLEDLQEDWQKKLALEPTPPPPPVKALITPLSSEEQDKLDAAAAATANGKHKDMWIIDQKLNAKDFGTLLPRKFNGDPRAWLNDQIVNEYLGTLVAKIKADAGFKAAKGGPAPPVHAFSSFWYSTLKSDRKPGVSRWAARFHLAGKQYLDADVLLYPICDAGHWRLLAVKPKERTIEYLDSMGWPGDHFIQTMKEYLASELKELYVEEEWTVLEKQRSSQQLNGSDCGVFTLLNSLALLRGEETNRVLACNGMLEARERIAVTLMNGAPTTELE